MNASIPLSATGRFALVIDGLCRAVAARISTGTLAAPLIVLICNRLRRIESCVQALATRIRAGALRPGATCPRRFAGRQAAPSLPRGFGWLLPLVPQHAAGYASQLRHLLADPEMAALVAATPRMRRFLNPLCRMLGVEPALLGPPPVPSPATTLATTPATTSATTPALEPPPPVVLPSHPPEHRPPPEPAPVRDSQDAPPIWFAHLLDTG